MSTTDKSKQLNELLARQQALLNAIKAEAEELGGDTVVAQNEALTAALEKSSAQNQALTQENEALKKELSDTKSALFNRMAQEKLSVFLKRQERIDQIYYAQINQYGNRLDDYERYCVGSLQQTLQTIDSYGTAQYDDLRARLTSLQQELYDRHAQLEQYRKAELDELMRQHGETRERFQNEPLLETEKRAALRQKSLESFVGLNLLSKAGVLLFLVGIVTLGRFAYVHLPDVFKGGMIYLLGVVLIGLGEWFHKKEKTAFSMALIGGGVSVLYAATATCYFAFGLFGARVTFLLCIVITAIAIAISHQVKSEVVCAFAAIGGYLPVVAAYMISFSKAAADSTFLPVSSVYFCLLALVIFLMTYNKKWFVAQFIGYSLHLIAIGGVSACAWAVRNLGGYSYALGLAVAFSVVSYVIYLMIPVSKIAARKAMEPADVLLLTLNTVSGVISLCLTVKNLLAGSEHVNRAMGIIFLVFALIYGGLMLLSGRERETGNHAVTALTSVFALVFSMLVVPFLFGLDYAPVAWAVEGALLAVISIERRLLVPELAGLVCMVMAAAVFIARLNAYDKRLTALSLISFGVLLGAYWIYTVRGFLKERESGGENALYVVTELLSALFSVVYFYRLYLTVLNGPAVSLYSSFTNAAVILILCLVMAVLLRVGVLENAASLAVSDIAGALLMLACVAYLDISQDFRLVHNFYGADVESSGYSAFNLVLLFGVNLAVLLFFARAVSHIIDYFKAPAWLYTAALSAASLAVITAIAMEQFDVKFSSVIISAVYIAAACMLLLIGFRKNFTVVRSGGLVLILVAFAKLCFVDTFHLDSGWKIVSYFAFGAVLIVISYFYQRFTRKLEKSAVSVLEESEDEV